MGPSRDAPSTCEALCDGASSPTISWMLYRICQRPLGVLRSPEGLAREDTDSRQGVKVELACRCPLGVPTYTACATLTRLMCFLGQIPTSDGATERPSERSIYRFTGSPSRDDRHPVHRMGNGEKCEKIQTNRRWIDQVADCHTVWIYNSATECRLTENVRRPLPGTHPTFSELCKGTSQA